MLGLCCWVWTFSSYNITLFDNINQPRLFLCAVDVDLERIRKVFSLREALAHFNGFPA